MKAKGVLKVFLVAITVALTSGYLFPFVPTFMHINSKMAMAIIGIGVAIYNMARHNINGMRKDMLVLSVWGLLISLFSLLAITYNSTQDYTYVTYLVSMWVWISGAYTLISWIRWVHGNASIVIVGNYLAVVCVVQCILALAIDSSPFFHNLSERIQGPQFWLESKNRLYGIGACLDTAGIRFSLVLTIIAFILGNIEKWGEQYKKFVPLYWIAFFTIMLIGNIIARTTVVGVALGLIYLVIKSFKGIYRQGIMWRWFCIILLIAIPLVTYNYRHNSSFRKNFEFGFEGFFSLIETGHWQVGSNEQLVNMIVFPDNTKTWLVGDGYFVNPAKTDNHYIGEITDGYYKNTDIGYLRFIFYFGIFGLIAFCFFILSATKAAAKRLPKYRILLLLFCLINFIVWFKVATDEFIIFALMLLLDPKDCEPEPELIEESHENPL